MSKVVRIILSFLLSAMLLPSIGLAQSTDRSELDELAEDPVAIRPEMRQHTIVGHHFPPSMESTWPLIQLA